MQGEELKKFRLQKGFTQKSLAVELGISKTAYCKRENGLIEFTLKEIRKIIDVLEMSQSDFIRIFFNNKVA